MKKLRSFRSTLSLVLLVSSIAACGGDDVAPPEVDGGGTDSGGMDAGGTDAGPRDAGNVDANALDAALDAALDDGGIDAAVCPDEDGDGHGASPCGDDCDDTSATTFPGGTETCNGIDDDRRCDDGLACRDDGRGRRHPQNARHSHRRHLGAPRGALDRVRGVAQPARREVASRAELRRRQPATPPLRHTFRPGRSVRHAAQSAAR